MISYAVAFWLGVFGSGVQVADKPITTCQWPNTCSVKAVEVAQFRPCVWPNTCKAVEVAQFQTCVWPNRCNKKA